MTIEKNKVVSINYTLTDVDNNVLDTSEGRDPLAYIQGIGNLIPGLEAQLEGKKAGDKVKATVEPKDAYGERQEEMVQVVPKAGFQSQDPNDKLQEGMQVRVETNAGPQIAMVTKIENEDVTLDLNHPLAGMTLNFDVEVMEVRDAEKEELEHGHVHGPDGHQH